LKPSPTLTITAKARQLKSEGKDVVSFAAGEPDFNTPTPIIEAANKALQDGFTKYTPTPGMPTLREAISQKLQRENGVKFSSEQVVVSTGAKQSLFNAIMTIVDPGDEVIVFAPYWMTYIEQITLAGGVPVVVKSGPSEGFLPSIEAIESVFTYRTKAVILNSPCNPSGAVFSTELLEWLGDQAVRRDFWLISDEIYEKLVFDVDHKSVASINDEVAQKTVTINGFSKTFAMTGWRVGYAAAPLAVAKAMSNLQDQVTSNATSFAQSGALAALQMNPETIEQMRQEFQTRRDMIVRDLNAIPGVNVSTPNGAFYVLPDFSSFCDGNDVELADFLLESALVATVPGSVFGANGHIRLSYATSRTDIEQGVQRIKEALSRLSK